MSALNSVIKLLNSFDSDEKVSSDTSSSVSTNGDLEPNITYGVDVGRHFTIEMPTKTNPKGNFDVVTEIIKTKVRNGRNLGITYGTYGFQLITQNTTLSTKDFYCNPDGIIQKVYYKELEQRVKEFTGAEYVKCMHHIVRCRKPPAYAKKGGLKPAEPAHAAHTDYSANNAFKTYQRTRPKDDKYKQGRYTVLNVWRNISDTNVIKQDHLAFCDGRTANGPDDFVPYYYIANGYKSESYYANAIGAQINKYKWYYFPDMTKNEMLIFRQFDSDFSLSSRYAFHSAIRDETAGRDAPPRESIEARMIAFFPNHEPNTIPVTVEVKSEDAIKEAIAGVFNAISAEIIEQYWPAHSMASMAKDARNKSVEDLITDFVIGQKKVGYLKCPKEEDWEMVTEGVLKRKEEFLKICLENFPEIEESKVEERSTEDSALLVSEGIKGVLGSVKAFDYWPEEGKKATEELWKKNKDSIRKVIESLVQGSADGGHNGLGDATKKELAQVIDGLCEKKGEICEAFEAEFGGK